MPNPSPFVKLTSPFGDDLTFKSLYGEEAVSEPFYYHVTAESSKPSLSADSIVGKNITLTFQAPSCSAKRYINGVCTRFVATVRNQHLTQYVLEVRPWLWMLTMQADCAVYQNLSAPDIVSKVCSAAGFTAVSDKTSGEPPKRPFTVQYNETAFHFISRILEEDGIFYYFKHTSSTHTLVLANSPDAFESCAGSDSLQYIAANMMSAPDAFITDIAITQEAIPSEFTLGDYYYQTPSTDLTSQASGSGTGSLYEYPGKYQQKSEGDTLASTRLDAREAHKITLRGKSAASGLYAGGAFTISKHARNDINTKWALTRLKISAAQQFYSAIVTAVPATTKYRPLRVTPKPVIAGPLTAIVTGAEGDEISVDNYGCITVQFYWDRKGEKNETSSCPVRVAQPWAGKNIGTMFIPRVGTEVVVTFINGDPDRPLVTGQVYNADMTYPYPLPDAMTKTALCTMSSKEGSEGHQLYLEDKKDAEEAFFSATKDVTVKIKNSRTTTISEADESLTLEKGNRSVEITEGTDTLKSGGKRSVTVEADEEHTTSGNFTGKVEGDQSYEITGNQKTEISADRTLSVTGNSTEEISGNSTHEITGNLTQTIDGNCILNIEGTLTINAAEGITVNSEGNVSIIAEQNLTTEATMAATHSATAAMTIEGLEFSLVGETGGTIEGGAMLDMTSGMVMIE